MIERLASGRYDGPEKTLAERAYRLIREDIVAGDLKPGLKLKIQMLQERYGLGAGPLREALAKLSSDQLVELEGQRGCRVAMMSVKDAREIGDLRKVLEAQALALSIPAGDEAWETALITAYHRLEQIERRMNQGVDDLPEWELRNNQFHTALVAACDSRWLQWMRQLMFDQHERYRRLSRMKTMMTRDINEEHKALFEAAMDRDVNKAVAVIGVHVQRTTDAVLTALADPVA
jgi:DNA-binding GntR family transcriptional regulator